MALETQVWAPVLKVRFVIVGGAQAILEGRAGKYLCGLFFEGVHSY